ncbi:peptidyl-glycine alpha-amidating monooxygenase B-like isoform X1 [Mytilus trossulus]|uniref:peptidyl-glycine alpha-amidating monooxygenase B-like isoform X1 n=1 Tax=Mytilus trossulus TaxID=6551 RepID=UPI003006E7E7
MAAIYFSLCVILGIASTVYGRPRTEDERVMIDEFLPALLDRIQNNPEYAFLLDSDIPSKSIRQQNSPVQQQENWPQNNLKLGQVAGVAVDNNGDVLVFHRGDRAWGARSFDFNNELSQVEQNKGPIRNATILRLNKNGTVIQRLGDNRFFMPHGLTVDKKGNLWVTDVGLHQVIKIPADPTDAGLVLGEAMKPGSDNEHFCKPTDVAVASNGHFFVSDGYCNGRIMKFTKDGMLIKTWGKPTNNPVEFSADDELFIPHSITLIEESNLVAVADREHGRIQLFTAGITDPNDTGRFVKSISNSRFGKVFAISYDPTDKMLYVVNGPTGSNKVEGFTVGLDGNIRDTWTPRNMNFDEPHDVAVSPDGHQVYVAEIRPNRITKFNK